MINSVKSAAARSTSPNKFDLQRTYGFNRRTCFASSDVRRRDDAVETCSEEGIGVEQAERRCLRDEGPTHTAAPPPGRPPAEQIPGGLSLSPLPPTGGPRGCPARRRWPAAGAPPRAPGPRGPPIPRAVPRGPPPTSRGLLRSSRRRSRRAAARARRCSAAHDGSPPRGGPGPRGALNTPTTTMGGGIDAQGVPRVRAVRRPGSPLLGRPWERHLGVLPRPYYCCCCCCCCCCYHGGSRAQECPGSERSAARARRCSAAHGSATSGWSEGCSYYYGRTSREA